MKKLLQIIFYPSLYNSMFDAFMLLMLPVAIWMGIIEGIKEWYKAAEHLIN